MDATHSVQQMGGAGGSTAGLPAFIPAQVRGAAAVGIDALFIEQAFGANTVSAAEFRVDRNVLVAHQFLAIRFRSSAHPEILKALSPNLC
jgi:3-deoxy-D-manno-octulosonic acid (KDO) 8-phosphate synthase